MEWGCGRAPECLCCGFGGGRRRGKFVYFVLVSGVPVFLGGEAGGTDPRSPQSPYYVASTASGGAGTARIAAHRLTAERRALGTGTARR